MSTALEVSLNSKMFTRQTIGLLSWGLLCSLLLLKRSSVEQKCDNLLSFGRWSSVYQPSDPHLLWQPFDSMIQVYDKKLLSRCLSNRTLYFIGDSTVRQVFWAVASKYDKDRAEAESAEAAKHQNIVYSQDSITLSFIWDPYLNSSQTKEIISNPLIKHFRSDPDPVSRSHVAGIITSTGLWQGRYRGERFADEHLQALNMTVQYTPKTYFQNHRLSDAYLAMPPAIILPFPDLQHDWLNPERAKTLSTERLANLTENLLDFQERHGLEVAWSTRTMTMNNSAAISTGGLHVTREIAAHQAEVLLNRVCNNALFSGSKKAFSLACVRQPPWRISAKACLGILLLTLAVGALVRAYKFRSKHVVQRAQAVLIMCIMLSYCWSADRTTLFEKGNKLVDVRLFGIVTASAITVSLVRLKSGPRNVQQALPLAKVPDLHTPTSYTLLPREVTEEWKGWMQIVILLYHYFGMSKTLPIYQSVRLCVAAYLFLTGYGHASYFLRTKDFSLKRVVKVVLRLNLLTSLLSIVMDNDHEFYYFPALATVWFLITYAVFCTPNARQSSSKELYARMLAMMSFSFIVLGDEQCVKVLTAYLRHVRGPGIDAREFVFRFRLDLLAPFAGMCLALVESRQTASRWVHTCAQLEELAGVGIIKTIKLGFTLLSIGIYVYIAGKFDDKVKYNAWHGMLSVMPIMAYLSMRKVLWDSWRYYAPVLTWIGSNSLELFVLQYHVWLAADTKGLLRLGLFDQPYAKGRGTTKESPAYWVETTIVTTMFIWMSHCCSRATNTLVVWFVQEGEGDNVKGRRTLLMRVAIAFFLLWLLKNVSNAETRS